MKRIWIIISLASLCSCGNIPQSEKQIQSLELGKDSHPTGWQKDRCLLCHHASRIHNRPNSVWEAYDQHLTNERVKNEGNACCADCHGKNR